MAMRVTMIIIEAQEVKQIVYTSPASYAWTGLCLVLVSEPAPSEGPAWHYLTDPERLSGNSFGDAKRSMSVLFNLIDSPMAPSIRLSLI